LSYNYCLQIVISLALLSKPIVALPRDKEKREAVVDKLLKPVGEKPATAHTEEKKEDEDGATTEETTIDEPPKKGKKSDKKQEKPPTEFGTTTAHKGTQILVQDKTQGTIGLYPFFSMLTDDDNSAQRGHWGSSMYIVECHCSVSTVQTAGVLIAS